MDSEIDEDDILQLKMIDLETQFKETTHLLLNRIKRLELLLQHANCDGEPIHYECDSMHPLKTRFTLNSNKDWVSIHNNSSELAVCQKCYAKLRCKRYKCSCYLDQSEIK